VAEPDRTDQEREVRLDRSRQLPPGVAVAVALLILAPIVALMWVGSYANDGPRLWGFPFFYWYQLMWVFIASACTWLAYVLVRNARRGGDR
jgi:membrane protein implicated in regulation of membrane protease activity